MGYPCQCCVVIWPIYINSAPYIKPITLHVVAIKNIVARGLHSFCTSFQWRHNGRGSVSNHQSHYCLLNRLFRRRSNKTSKLRITGLCAGNSPVNSPHKWPVTRRMFPFNDVIMSYLHLKYSSTEPSNFWALRKLWTYVSRLWNFMCSGGRTIIWIEALEPGHRPVQVSVQLCPEVFCCCCCWNTPFRLLWLLLGSK